MIRTLLQTHNVLVDGTHTSKPNILRLLDIDKHAEFVFLNTTPHLCIQRAYHDNMSDLESTIKRLYNNLVHLTGVVEMNQMAAKLSTIIDEIRT